MATTIATVRTPVCECGNKFPGDICCKCGRTAPGLAAIFAEADRREASVRERARRATSGPRRPAATRKRRKHGRQ